MRHWPSGPRRNAVRTLPACLRTWPPSMGVKETSRRFQQMARTPRTVISWTRERDLIGVMSIAARNGAADASRRVGALRGVGEPTAGAWGRGVGGVGGCSAVVDRGELLGDLGVVVGPAGAEECDVVFAELVLNVGGFEDEALVELAAEATGGGEVDEDGVAGGAGLSE